MVYTVILVSQLVNKYIYTVEDPVKANNLQLLVLLTVCHQSVLMEWCTCFCQAVQGIDFCHGDGSSSFLCPWMIYVVCRQSAVQLNVFDDVARVSQELKLSTAS